MKSLLASLLLVPLLGACGDSGAGGAVASEEPGLPEGQYAAVGLPEPFDSADELSLRVAGGEVSFQATCNTMSGTASVEGDRLVVDSIGGTEMGCEDPGADQDRWLTDFFGSRPELVADGDGFVLRGEGVDIPFRPADEVGHHVPLDSVVWLLTGIEETDGDAVSMRPVPAGLGAGFEVTGAHFRLETGCNTASGSVVVGEGTLETGRTLVTERGCDDRALEEAQLGVITGDDVTWSVDDDRLQLGNGDVTLLYEAGR